MNTKHIFKIYSIYSRYKYLLPWLLATGFSFYTFEPTLWQSTDFIKHKVALAMQKKYRWMESYPPEKQKQLRRLHLLSALYNSKIILRYVYRNHSGEVDNAAIEFLTIPVFKNYLESLPQHAELIGYKSKIRKPTHYIEVCNMKVCINWKEGNTRLERQFPDVWELARFLKSNPDLGESLQFPFSTTSY